MNKKVMEHTAHVLFGIGVLLSVELSFGIFGALGSSMQLSPFLLLHDMALHGSKWIANVTVIFALVIGLLSFFKKGLVYNLLNAHSLNRVLDEFERNTKKRLKNMNKNMHTQICELERKNSEQYDQIRKRQKKHEKKIWNLWESYEMHAETLILLMAKSSREISKIACSARLENYFNTIKDEAETMLKKFK